VEVSDAVDEHLWPRVLNAGERTWLQSCAEQGRPLWATVIFSAKEAFYKCQYPVTGQWLEFEDAHVELGRAPWSLPMASSAAFSITVTSSKVSLSGRGQVTGGYVCTAFSWP
jgi:4'-phosphopantetheinyl transferase EntD